MMALQSLREMIDRGVELTFGEAVALAQQLITSTAADVQPSPPFGPPSLDSVRLGPDGSVECRGCATTPAVSEIAVLLEAMLPSGGTTRVPGALRYTIARALLEVDAPPFDSVAALSAALRRHELGERSVVLRRLYARAAAMSPRVAGVDAERRRRAPSVAELRRQLRQADEALFRQAHLTQPPSDESPVPLEVDSLVLCNEPVAGAPTATVARSATGRWVLGGAVAAMISFATGYAIVDRIHTQAARAQNASVVRPVSPSSGAALSPSPGVQRNGDGQRRKSFRLSARRPL